MAHQIVATSVPRGLDGVSGYQTVLKSAGIPPRVFDRLKARSGYSHRYPHGDRRNPVVYLHRIEELAGSRWHVLGCIRDAGSDHTGRSNFLAHMLAIATDEARGKPGGPAAAAMARGCFLDKWDRPPESTAPAKTLVVADRPAQPGDAPAWIGAGLDPGFAGDLAAAAMANRKVVMVTRPDDNVLALFADAMRMVEPSKRWGVTFNTCAIEDFDGTWKAVRVDLADPKDLRDGNATLIDLTKTTRGSADQYARFARGEVDELPWQKRIAELDPEPETKQTATAIASKAVDPKPGTKDPKKSLKRNSGTSGEGSSHERRPRYEEDKPSRPLWHAITIGGLGFLLIGCLVAFTFRDHLMGLVLPPQSRLIEPATEVSPMPEEPKIVNAKDTPEYQALTKLKEAKARLENVVGGKTGHDLHDLRDGADKLLKRIENLRSWQADKPALRIMADAAPNAPDRDPSLGVKKVILVCNRVAEILEPDGEPKIEDLRNAESDFKDAVANLSRLLKQVEELADAEGKKSIEQQIAKDKEAERKIKEQAFTKFKSLSKSVSLPMAANGSSTDIGDSPPKVGVSDDKVDLGPFSFADLVEPRFRLAVPRDTVDNADFKAEIEQVRSERDLRWEIRYVPSAVALDGGKQIAKSRTLAYLVVSKDNLSLEVERDSNELKLHPFNMLRRSVILVEAKDPAAPLDPAVVREIRLVQPTQLRPLKIDLLAQGQGKLDLKPPPGIARRVNSSEGQSQLALPINSLRFEAEFPKGEKVDFKIANNVNQAADTGIRNWEREIAPLNPDLAIQAVIKLSLPAATMTVNTKFSGAQAGFFSEQDVKEYFIDKPKEGIALLRRLFNLQVKKGCGFSFEESSTEKGREKITAWFNTRSASPKGAGIPMQDHETIQKSFEKFLGSLPGVPQTYKDFTTRCIEVKDESQWKAAFTDRIEAWAKWFWPQCEKQWQESAKLFQGAVAEQHTIRITAITSLAYDEKDNEYEVPLVIGKSGADHAPGRNGGPGPDGGDSVDPTAGEAGGNSVGID